MTRTAQWAAFWSAWAFVLGFTIGALVQRVFP